MRIADLPQNRGLPHLPSIPEGNQNKESLNEINPTGLPQEDSAQLKRACQQFESFFALQLWRAMKQTVPTSQTTMNYTDMFDMHFADYLTQGRGLGLGEILYQQLNPLLEASPEQSHGMAERNDQ
ncbi:MAG: rod-binding protein [Fimbriimonadia bacterium]|nr:rod-binding protein [Fimbriimonadia bacterium]